MENTSGTVKKALDILDAFLLHGGELSLQEVTRITGYNRATVFRLISTLVQGGLISQESKKGKYFLGLRTLDFGFVVRTRLSYLETIYLHMSKLCREQSVAVNTAILDADKVLILDEIGITNEFRITPFVGRRLPLHATAAGKLMLAHMPDEERKAYYKRNPLEQVTKYTITNIKKLEKQLVVAKKNGIAYDHQERILGNWAVACPVYKGKDLLVAVTIVAPFSLIDSERSEQLSASLMSRSTEISLVLNRHGNTSGSP